MLSSELVRSVLDSAPDAMIIIDSAGKILFANRQVSALFGYAAAELVDGPVEKLLPERFRGRHVGHRSDYTHNVRVRPMGMGLELFGMRKDGTEFPVEISLSPIDQGSDVRVAAAIRDVTERKQTEKELREARRDAEHANLAKSRFLATASHDLRQPLQTLGLLNGALRRMIRDEECLELLREQDQAVDAMSRLLNALLDISKLESGAIKLELTDFDMDALFEQLRRDFASVASNKGLELAIEKPNVTVHSDPALVSQMLRNLLSNAIKYTQQGTVQLHCEIGGGKLRVAVRDTGVGIAPDQVGMIFDEFYQIGVTPNSSRDGYGLGLSIVQRIARLLELKVQVESDLGKGSIFSFELPAVTSSRSAAEPGAATQSGGAKSVGNAVRILLVEDEPSVRNAMRMLLKIEGYHVTIAATAEEALQLLRGSNRFDLLITDYHLEGGRTGTQVIAAAREIVSPSFKAVLVTGDTSSAVREMQCDAQLRITSKPINSDELLALIKALLAA
jgi:PAS domain S-box-containing protein